MAVTETGAPSKQTDDEAWRGFVLRFIAVFVGLLAVTLALILLIDPYDSGRFPDIGISGISDTNQRTANVSLGRSGKFNAAIFGNSHGQLLDPGRLTQATGLSFVQLVLPGTYAPEQLAMMHWFIRHHSRIGALVLAADERWCSDNPQPWRWFPFWLYADSDMQYLLNSLNTRSAGAAFRRIKHALGLLHPSHPRGYEDYELTRPPDYKFDLSVPPETAPVMAASVDGPFPAIERLAAEIAAAPGAPLVVVFAPVYFAGLPHDAGEIAVLKECKARLARVAVGTPDGGFLDYFVDSPLTRDAAGFQNFDHIRAPLARRIEGDIVGLLNGTAAAKK